MRPLHARSLAVVLAVAAAATSHAGRPAGSTTEAALQEIARSYDWRGREDLVLKAAYRLGRALASRLIRERPDRRLTALLGGDARLTSPAILRNLRRGLRASGVDVIELGRISTPEAYEADRRFHPDATLQVTASHNPAGENGVKAIMFGKPVHGEQLQRISAEAARGDFVPARGDGRRERRPITRAYLTRVRANLTMGPRRFKIVVDAQNGMGGALVRLLRGYGFETYGLNLRPDGRFPNSVGHRPDPSIEENLEPLRARVRATGAEIGIALDADVDRVVVVDRRGRTILGDNLMALLAPRLLAAHPEGAFVTDVTASDVPREVIERAGGRFVRGPVGRTNVVGAIERERALMGAEVSGHVWSGLGYDDGLYAAARLVAELSHGPATLGERVDALPHRSTSPVIRLRVADAEKRQAVERVRRALLERHPEVKLDETDGVRAVWPDGAWGLVRASGTGPELSLRFEAATPERMAEIRRIMTAPLE